MKEHFKALGLPVTDDLSQIKSAYRQAVKRLHPDLNGGKQKSAEIYSIIESYNLILDYLNSKNPIPDPTITGNKQNILRRLVNAERINGILHVTLQVTDKEFFEQGFMAFIRPKGVRTRHDEYRFRFGPGIHDNSYYSAKTGNEVWKIKIVSISEKVVNL